MPYWAFCMRSPRSGRRHSYGFGMVRSIEAQASREAANELAQVLSTMTGSVFFSYNAFGYRELADGIANGDLGFAWMPPVPAIDLLDEGVATTLALPVRRRAVTYNAALVVRRGSGATLDTLKGKRVSWVDRE